MITFSNKKNILGVFLLMTLVLQPIIVGAQTVIVDPNAGGRVIGAPATEPKKYEQSVALPGMYYDTQTGETIDFNERMRRGLIEQNEKSKTLPTQERKPEGEETTDAAADVGKCTLASMVTGLGKQLFSSTLGSVGVAALNPLAVPVVDVNYTQKEVGAGPTPSWDKIGWCIANTVIQYISESTIEWIKNGFNGNPVFVDNPEKLFEDIAKDTIDVFIDSIGDGILCERFALNITMALRNHNQKKIPPACTLQKAMANFDRFFTGEDFSFEMFDYVTQNPQNNYVGAYVSAQGRIAQAIADRANTTAKELDWGSGFLSWKDDEGRTVTPGKVTVEVFGKNTMLASDRLVLADELDKVLDALIEQLIKSVATEILM